MAVRLSLPTHSDLSTYYQENHLPTEQEYEHNNIVVKLYFSPQMVEVNLVAIKIQLKAKNIADFPICYLYKARLHSTRGSIALQ